MDETMRYYGVLGLLCEASVYVPEEIREQMERALEEACQDGTMRWYRIINRLELETVPTDRPRAGKGQVRK